MKAQLQVTLVSRFFVQYSAAEKKFLKEAFVMESVQIPHTYVFFGHGCIHHADSERRSEHYICCHSYLSSGNHDLPDALALAYKDSTALGAEKHSVLVEKSLS